MMRKRAAIIGCMGLLVSGHAAAQMGMGGAAPGMGAAPVLRDPEGETMVMTLPNGWTPYRRTAEEKDEIYVFPSGQDVTDWRETLRQEAFNSTAGIETATRVYELRTENDPKSCAEYSSEMLGEGQENGYSMVTWKQVCDLVDGSRMASLHKSVLGNERLYILSKIWKRNPANSVWDRWETYVGEVYVCDPEREEHPCRPAGAPAGGMGAAARR